MLPCGARRAPSGGALPGGDTTSSRGGAAVPLRLQHVRGFFAVPFWYGRQPSVRFF